MKMLVTRTPTADAVPFDLTALKLFLRVDHDDEDAIISEMGYAAAGEIEGFASIALLTQTIRLTVFDPTDNTDRLLPIGPILDAGTVLVTVNGEPFTDFEAIGGNRPLFRWGRSFYEQTCTRLTIEYEAGFGAAATSIPRDLSQAVLDQALMLYEARGISDTKQRSTSPHMTRIGARYRGVSL